MKKTLIIILSLLLVIVAVVGLYINNTRKLVKYAEKNNKEYENFYQQEILGTTLISIINKAINDNEKNGVPKEAKTPSSESDNLHVDVIDMKQKYEEKTKKKSLKVENGKDVQTVLSDASIKTIDGGYEEMNKEQSGREKSGR